MLSPQAQAIYDNLIETEYKKPFSEEEPFAGLVAACGQQQQQPYQLPGFVKEAVSVQETQLDSLSRIFTMTPKDGPATSEKHVLYFHGGAFLLNIFDTQWQLCISLVQKLGCTVHMLEYPLAPTYTYKETYASMMAAYRWVFARADAQNVVLAGDSVGAHMVIAAAQLALQEALPQPALIVAMSPWIDFANLLPGKAELEAGDPVIGMVSLYGIPATWCKDIVNQKAAPPNLQYGPFLGMAPIYIQVGSTEVLQVDAIELQRLVLEAGGTVEMEVGEGLWHTYALYADMPEGEAAVDAIAKRIAAA